jgi:hypothetical protein
LKTVAKTRARSKVGNMTKAELIKAIERRIAKAKPIVRNDFVKSLKHQTKSTLTRYLMMIKVDRDGSGIRV